MTTPSLSARLPSAKPWISLPQATLIILCVTVGFVWSYLTTDVSWIIPLLGGTVSSTAVTWIIPFGVILSAAVIVLLFKFPFYVFSLWLLVAPFLMLTDTGAARILFWIIHRILPPAMAGFLALTALWPPRGTNKTRLSRLGWPELAMAGYVLASLISIYLFNKDRLAEAVLLYDRTFGPMCLYLLIRLWHPDEKDIRRLMPAIFFVAASQAFFGIAFWVAPQYFPSVWVRYLERTTGSLQAPTVYSATMLFCGAVLLHAAITRKRGIVRLLYEGGAIVAFFCVFLSLSRASWLAEILVLAGLACLYRRYMIRLSLLALPVILIIGGLFSTQILILARDRLDSPQSERSALSRLPVYVAGIRMFLAKPVTGWGYGNFNRYDRLFQVRFADIADDNKDHASHNLYITTIAEQGLLGITLLLFPMAWWLVLSRRRRLELPPDGLKSRKLLAVLWLSILAHIVVNNFSNMHIPFGLGLWWTTLSLIASLVDQESVSKAPAGCNNQ